MSLYAIVVTNQAGEKSKVNVTAKNQYSAFCQLIQMTGPKYMLEDYTGGKWQGSYIGSEYKR